MICLTCLQRNDSTNCCNYCKSNNALEYKKRKYYYNGQVYSKEEWFKQLSNFQIFTNDNIILRRFSNKINVTYLRDMFLKNVRKYTFLWLILPCVVFSTLTLVFLWIGLILQNNVNIILEGNLENVIICIYSLDLFYAFISFYFFMKLLKKEKVYITKDRNKTRLKHITYQSYMEMLEKFNINIKG